MRLILPLLTSLSPLVAQADPISIVTDIAPVHSLVTLVAGPDTEIEVLVSAGASPHGFQFTFDQAQALQDADVVIWAGEALTPWLHESLETLAPDVTTLELLETGGWTVLPLREDPAFDVHDDHDHAGHDHDEHEHGAHDDEEHGTIDPHAWLDPQVAMVWVTHIRDTLISADPDNADLYTARAAQAQTRLGALDSQVVAYFSTLEKAPYLVPHDAYQYLESRAGHAASGAISLSDSTAPSPAHIAELQALIRDAGVVCVLSDPQSRQEWVDLVRDGTDVRTALADPIGGAFELGDTHYFQTVIGVTEAFLDCING